MNFDEDMKVGLSNRFLKPRIFSKQRGELTKKSTLKLLESPQQKQELDSPMVRQVNHLLMMSTNACKEKEKRANMSPDRKKSVAFNSDLGEIFEAK